MSFCATNLEKISKALLEFLMRSGIQRLLCVASVKEDGRSVIIEVLADQGLQVISRTDKKWLHLTLSREEAALVLSRRAIEMRVTLLAEMCAYIEGKQAGFIHALTALNRFKGNGNRNVGKLELRFHVFGVYQADGRDASTMSHADMASLVREGSGLIRVVECLRFAVQLTEDKRGLHFLTEDGSSTVAVSLKALADHLLGLADATGQEGWVFSAPPEVFRHKALVMDSHGKWRNHAIKVKRAYPSFPSDEAECNRMVLLAVAVHTKSRTKKIPIKYEIFLYGINSEGFLVKVGEATTHKVVPNMMPKSGNAFSYDEGDSRHKARLNKLERPAKDLMLSMQKNNYQFIQIACSCTNILPNYEVTGMKNQVAKVPITSDTLSNVHKIANENPHFKAIQQAHYAIKKYKERDPVVGHKRPRKKQSSDEEEEEDYTTPPRSPQASGGSLPAPVQAVPAYNPPLAEPVQAVPAYNPPLAEPVQAAPAYNPPLVKPNWYHPGVYIDGPSKPSEEELEVIHRKLAGARYRPAEWGQDRVTIGVFSTACKNLCNKRGIGPAADFVKHHPDATIMTLEELEALLDAKDPK